MLNIISHRVAAEEQALRTHENADSSDGGSPRVPHLSQRLKGRRPQRLEEVAFASKSTQLTVAAQLRMVHMAKTQESAADNPLLQVEPALQSIVTPLSDACLPNYKNLHWSDLTLKGELGHGYHGRVFEAHVEAPQVVLAVKCLQKQRMRLQPPVEEQILQRLCKIHRHPNIVAYHKSFASSRHYYLLLDLCRGGDMFKVLQTHEALPERLCKIIVFQMASALAFIHRCGIAHLDVKLENMLLKEPLRKVSGDEFAEPCVQLCDFGISRLCPNKWVETGEAGTAEFAPPELLDKGLVSQKVDVWGLGVSTFMMLGGYHPFDDWADLQREEIVSKIVKGAPICYDGGHWSHASAQAREFVQWLLTRDVTQRPSMDEVLQHEFLRDVSLSAPEIKSHCEKPSVVSAHQRCVGDRNIEAQFQTPDSPASTTCNSSAMKVREAETPRPRMTTSTKHPYQ